MLLAGPYSIRPISFDLVTAIGAAMIPVIFAFGGWQTASFIAGEMREPAKNLPRGLMLGVTGVIILYLSVNFVDVHALGATGLAQTAVPASAVMRAAVGDRGAVIIAAGIALSALGFLSQSILTAPRVYFAMARDGTFFKERGVAASADKRACSGDRVARPLGDSDHAFGKLRTDPKLLCSDGLSFFRSQRDVPVCFPSARCAHYCQ